MTETDGRSSRRGILLAAIGGAVAMVAQSLGRPRAARAADGDVVTVGNAHSGSSSTSISTSGGNAIQGVTSEAGRSGLWGENTAEGFGVRGIATGAGSVGVQGSAMGTGVMGHWGAGSLPPPSADTGVYGHAANNSVTARGVLGVTDSGHAVHGTATGFGTGGFFEGTGTGPGLVVKGRVRFSRSGVLTIRAGRASRSKSGIEIRATTFLVATLQQRRAGVWVVAAVPDPGADSFTIYLNKSVAEDTRVAWILFG